MKFLADESVDIPVYLYLKSKGYSIDHVSTRHSGLTDIDVLRLAFSGKKILLTVDKDFGDLAFVARKPSFGIVLYRLSGLTNTEKSVLVENTLRQHKETLAGNFTVITKSQVRIRKLMI